MVTSQYSSTISAAQRNSKQDHHRNVCLILSFVDALNHLSLGGGEPCLCDLFVRSGFRFDRWLMRWYVSVAFPKLSHMFLRVVRFVGCDVLDIHMCLPFDILFSFVICVICDSICDSWICCLLVIGHPIRLACVYALHAI